MTKLDWSRAKQRATQGKPAGTDTLRQQVLQSFVTKHNLKCFKCGTQTGPWAAARRDTKPDGTTHRWAICTTCTTTSGT